MFLNYLIAALTSLSLYSFKALTHENPDETGTVYHDFPQLNQHYETSHYPNFSGISCAVIALNVLESNQTTPSTLGDQSIFTQENLFNPYVLSIITPQLVKERGIAIEELVQVFQVYGLKAKAQYPHIMTTEALTQIVQETDQDPNTLMIVYFDESHLSGKTGDHYALVAGYEPTTDSILLIQTDVEIQSKKWVKTDSLLKAMQALDENHTPHGFILIQKPLEN